MNFTKKIHLRAGPRATRWRLVFSLWLCGGTLLLALVLAFSRWLSPPPYPLPHVGEDGPGQFFPYVEVPYLLSGSGMFSRQYYLEHLGKAYRLFAQNTSAGVRLAALDRIHFYQEILLVHFQTTPAGLKSAGVMIPFGPGVPLAAGATDCRTPGVLPARTIQYLSALGVEQLVAAEVDHIFFTAGEDYPGIFPPGHDILATADPVTRSVVFALPMARIVEPALATALAHEAFHLKHNDEYPSYPASEKDAFAFELGLLQQIKTIFVGSLTDSEQRSIQKRVDSMRRRI